jgi:acyl carrier protein
VTASLAADHRVSDGRRGALFLAEIDRLLQEPDTYDPDLRAAFLADLTAVAPDLDPATVGRGRSSAGRSGLDSMDFLNLVSALHKRFGLPIPEADYPRLATPAKRAIPISARV